MGCRLSRTDSTEICEKEAVNSAAPLPDKRVTNGTSVLLRRDTPHNGLDLKKAQSSATTPLLGVPNKPIGEVESVSQADFFKMLDDKIQKGRGFESDADD